jgi:hypothetical protein
MTPQKTQGHFTIYTAYIQTLVTHILRILIYAVYICHNLYRDALLYKRMKKGQAVRPALSPFEEGKRVKVLKVKVSWQGESRRSCSDRRAR